MNLTNKHKLFIHITILFIASYLLTGNVLSGIKSNKFDFIKIGIYSLVLVYSIFGTIKYNKDQDIP